MAKEHQYEAAVTWTGNLGSGTSGYRAYARNHEVNAAGKYAPILGSSDVAFRGDSTRYNPEEMLVASLSSCHMLWYLHLCAVAGIVVTAYSDSAVGTMVEDKGGAGRFSKVTLRPRVTISDGTRIEEARALHARAHSMCFIASSVNFPVAHEPVIES